MRSREEIEEMLEKLNEKELKLKKDFQERFLEINQLGASIRLLDPDKNEIKAVESYIEMLEWVLDERIINKYEVE